MIRLTKEKAIRNWYKTKRYWEKSAKKFERKVLAIEDTMLREAVACVVELTCGDGAAFEFSISDDEKGFTLGDLVIDEEYIDVLEAQYTMEGIENARNWIRDNSRGKSMAFFMYAFGSVQFKGHKESDGDTGCVSDGVVLSIVHNEIVGLHLGGDPTNRRNVEPVPRR